MLLSLLYSLLFTLLPDPQTPNFYSGLMSAREASKKSQKEMIIFFSDKTCTTCEAAWAAFTKDAGSTSQYISTRMSRSDFDGGIFFDLLELEETPSWVILSPDGTEKERWSGGWKDASGNPTLYDEKTKVLIAVPTAQKNIVQETKSSLKTNPVTTTKNETVITSPKTNPVTTSVTNEKGFFLQAGYFGSEANAQKLLNDLKAKGFSSFDVKTESKEGKMFYRVSSKLFANETLAKDEQQKLSALGINVSLKW